MSWPRVLTWSGATGQSPRVEARVTTGRLPRPRHIHAIAARARIATPQARKRRSPGPPPENDGRLGAEKEGSLNLGKRRSGSPGKDAGRGSQLPAPPTLTSFISCQLIF